MNEGKRITNLEEIESVPAGSNYLVEAGDGAGTKRITHENLMKAVGEGLKVGDMEQLNTEAKDSFVKALNEVNEKASTAFEGTDGIRTGSAGMVPAPQPEDEGKVLGADGQWVEGGGAGYKNILKSIEETEANTEGGFLVDALVVKELINKPNDFEPVLDETGKMTGYKTSVGGADTVFPFSDMSQININYTLILLYGGSTQRAVNGTFCYYKQQDGTWITYNNSATTTDGEFTSYRHSARIIINSISVS